MIQISEGTKKERQIAGMERQTTEIISHAYDHGWKDGFEEAKRQAEQREEQGTFNNGYEKGYNEAKAEFFNNRYQEGLSDAWNAAFLGLFLSDKEIKEILGETNSVKIYHMGVNEVVEKIKAYEEKHKEAVHDEKIRVGDEVEHNFNLYKVYGITENGNCVCIGKYVRFFPKDDLKKTGRHFDEIEEFLKAMGGSE